MSRVGKQPVIVPAGVTVVASDHEVTVKGPKGELVLQLNPVIAVHVEDSQVVCTVAKKTKKSAAMWGTTRAHVANMVKGVTEGFSKKLELQGVGYRAALKGADLELLVGYSHPVKIKAPVGVAFAVEKELITITGIDRNVVGQVTADIRATRPPEPYKGKGIRYQGEIVRRKEGKVAGSA